MLSVVFNKPNEYELTDVPCPEVRTGHVLLKVHSTTICGSCARCLERFYNLCLTGGRAGGVVHTMLLPGGAQC